MTTHIGIASLTLARTVTGTAVYVYAGQPVVALDPDDAARLVKEGFLDVVPDAEVPEEVPTPDDPGTGTSSAGPGTEPVTQRPKRTAPKAAWLSFRGVPAERAEELTIEQLQDDELMDDWATGPADRTPPPAGS